MSFAKKGYAAYEESQQNQGQPGQQQGQGQGQPSQQQSQPDQYQSTQYQGQDQGQGNLPGKSVPIRDVMASDFRSTQ
jgi:hypothetical protein